MPQRSRASFAHFAALTPGRTVTSIFLGGGTPSLMQPATVDAVLEAIARLWPVAPDAEITLEANPGSAEAERFRGYRAAGVNRLSLGVQSLDDAALKALGRIHSVAEARRAVELARETFPRLSFDLIYARPAQTLARLAGGARSGDRAWRPTISRSTSSPSSRRRRSSACTRRASSPCPIRELAAELYALTQEITEARGLPAYEISNHAAPGARVAAQPHLLALPGLCRRRARRAWPHHRRRRQARDDEREASGALAGEGGGGRPRPRHRRGADAGGSRRRDAADGPSAARRRAAPTATAR